MSDAPIDLKDVCVTINALLKGKPFTLLCVLDGPDQPGLSISNCSREGMQMMIADAHKNAHSDHQTIVAQAGHG